MKFKLLSLAAVAALAFVGSAQAMVLSNFNIEDSYVPASRPDVPSLLVINEVYGGGGNAGAPFNQDFVELFNTGATAIDISGFSLQYGTATGSTFATFATFAVGTMIQAGSTFLVSAGSGGTNGVALPTPDFVGATTNFAATAGKIQLVNGTGTTVDLVGYGTTANLFEGAGPAPAPSNTTSISRTLGIDTDNNSLDFTAGMPSPMAAVPEPATYMLFGIGLLACAQRFRRRSKKA